MQQHIPTNCKYYFAKCERTWEKSHLQRANNNDDDKSSKKKKSVSIATWVTPNTHIHSLTIIYVNHSLVMRQQAEPTPTTHNTMTTIKRNANGTDFRNLLRRLYQPVFGDSFRALCVCSPPRENSPIYCDDDACVCLFVCVRSFVRVSVCVCVRYTENVMHAHQMDLFELNRT